MKTGFLRKTYLETPWAPGEARILNEISQRNCPTASEIGKALELDAGYLSRLIAGLEKQGMIERKALESDKRQFRLELTSEAVEDLRSLEAIQDKLIAGLLDGLSNEERVQLIDAMAVIERLLGQAASGEVGG